MTQPLYLLELNEINFEFVQRYGEKGRLPTLNTLVRRHGLGTTTSEDKYENVEPWIQWVTAHTGKPLRDHSIYRLGDIVRSDVAQVWELLEGRGIRVGAMSPMNAANRLNAPAFFVPDPWTKTPVSADWITVAMHRAVAQAVEENAVGRLTGRSLLALLGAFLRHVPIGSWPVYARLLTRVPNRPWIKATILDHMLADTFVSLIKSTRPQFATLFLNGGAHVQHHYMYNSAAYSGERKNPSWYVQEKEDPLWEIYDAYDQILRNIIGATPDARLIIATGLHQEPYTVETYYWRLANHRAFLTAARISYLSVEPLMSRDFLVTFSDASTARQAAEVFQAARLDDDNSPVFEIDNRGESLFCCLAYGGPLDPGQMLTINGQRVDLGRSVSFVALKNGHHSSTGYLIDTGERMSLTGVPLADVFHAALQHFDGQTARG